jgi:two-component system, LuxR family, sensor kinase FixL
MCNSEAEKLKQKASCITMDASVPSLVHELKQPLTAIRSNAQAAQRFLAMTSPDLVELRAILTDIIADTRHAEQLLQQGGSFGTHAPPARVPLDVNTLLQQVVHRLRREAAEHHVTITLELDAGLPTIAGDPLQLHQVVVNLIVNAFEAMQQTTVWPRQLVIRTARQDPRTLRVSLTDTGRGMDETTRQQMFTPFFTTKAEGRGLGLTMSQSIVTAHGGQIWALPQAEQGTTLCFTLPLGEQARRGEERAAETDATCQAPQPSRRRDA